MTADMSATDGPSIGEQLDLERSAPSTAQGIDAGTGDEAAQPPFEAIRIAKRREVPPGPDEAFLDRVSREFVVPEDQSGCRVQPRDEHAGKHGEGVMIASLCSLDELSLVHGHPLGSARRLVSRSDGSRRPSSKGSRGRRIVSRRPRRERRTARRRRRPGDRGEHDGDAEPGGLERPFIAPASRFGEGRRLGGLVLRGGEVAAATHRRQALEAVDQRIVVRLPVGRRVAAGSRRGGDLARSAAAGRPPAPMRTRVRRPPPLAGDADPDRQRHGAHQDEQHAAEQPAPDPAALGGKKPYSRKFQPSDRKSAGQARKTRLIHAPPSAGRAPDDQADGEERRRRSTAAWSRGPRRGTRRR